MRYILFAELQMEQIESYEISLLIKQLKLAVKFPCKLTFQHLGKAVSQEIPSNPSNIFVVNKDITLKEDKPKQHLQIAINLTTEKGGNIMAGIIRMALKDVSSAEGQLLTIGLQKCLDPSSTCTILLRSVRMARSRVKNSNLVDDRRLRPSNDKFETKSQAPFLDVRDIKHRAKYNEAEAFVSKRDRLAVPTSFKEKAYSTVGFKAIKDNSFEKDEFGSRFKHLNKRTDHQDSKTVVTGKWRDPEQALKSSMQATQKSLKLEIVKFKTKFQESERNVEEKNKQIKVLKDQISDLKREINDKHFLQEQLATKTNQITKLQQSSKALSKQLQEERNKIIDLDRELQEEKGRSMSQLSRLKQQFDKKEYEHLKNIYDRKEQIKELQQQNQYKVNQISKMKILIEDLEKNMQAKLYELQRNYNHEKSEHAKTKNILQAKISQLVSEIETHEATNSQIANNLANTEEDVVKLHKKLRQLQQALAQSQKSLDQQRVLKQSLQEEKKLLVKTQEQLNNKLKSVQKELSSREKQLGQVTGQLSQLSNSSKKKISEGVQKNKVLTTKVQQLQSKINLMATIEQKLRRNIELCQRDNKSLQQNQKIITKNLKMKDERILQVEKELSDLQNNYSLKENIGKKDLDYKAMHIDKMTLRLAELEKNYQAQKEFSEEKRLELLKAENKIKIAEEANSKISEQFKEAKSNWARREEELLLNVKQLQQDLKTAEGRESEAHKQISKLQTQKTSFKNEIAKLQKVVATNKEKYDRLKAKEADLQANIRNLTKQLQAKQDELLAMEGVYKNLQNDFKLLQADKFKNQKITTIISEEKDLAKNDINKLKKEVEKRDQKEEQYLSDVKALREQITKLEMRNAFLTKEHEKFKATLTESVKSAIAVKHSFYPSAESTPSNMDGTKLMQRSRFSRSQGSQNQNPVNLAVISQGKLGQAIEGVAKEAHQAITSLNEELKKRTRQKQAVERQYTALVARSKEAEAEHTQTIKEISNEIESLVARSAAESEQYEQKISILERENGKKERVIKQLMTEVQELNFTQQSERSSHSIAIADLLSKIDTLKYRLAEAERKDESQGATIINLQERIIELQQEKQELQHRIQIYVQQITKKDKAFSTKLQQIEDIKQELETVKKNKAELSTSLFAIQESLSVEKENNKNLLKQIKEQQAKNVQLRTFQSELLKEKEILIKKDLEKTEKIDQLEQHVKSLTNELAARNEEVTKKSNSLNQSKEAIKNLQASITSLQASLAEAKAIIQKQRQKVKEKQRKIAAKDAEIEVLNAQIKKTTAKFETQLHALNQEYEAVQAQIIKQRERFTANINELQSQLKKLKETEKRLSEDNMALQESIYFEKQANALSTSRIQQLSLQINSLQFEINKHQSYVTSLNEQLKEKQEALYSMSGKLYASDNRVESKEEEYKQKIEQVQMGWRYKLEEICEEYENKLEAIQKQKNYVKTGLSEFNESAQRLQSEKNAIKADLQREKEVWQAKVKKIEEEKIAALIDKNRQIEKLRQIIEELQERLSRKDQDFKTVEDDRKKLEQKVKELRVQVEKAEQKIKVAHRNLQKEVDQMKRKEGQLKRFKDALKNNQWTIEREVKKSVQSCTKSINSLCQEQVKPKVLDLMRNLQSSVIRLACSNIDEL